MPHRAAAHVTVIDHPVVQEYLTRARDAKTDSPEFRRLIGQISRLMAFEITRGFPRRSVRVDTPLGPAEGSFLARGLTLVPVLRAGLGMTEGVLELLPRARVGYLGIYRDEQSLQPVVYYKKFPAHMAATEVIVIDPMLATAGSLCAAIDAVKQAGATSIKVLCLVSAPEGIACLAERHADVEVYTAAVDERLDERGYIVPGLGDAGDRLFGTA
jgi:uracil phosphoribosyltransferase